MPMMICLLMMLILPVNMGFIMEVLASLQAQQVIMTKPCEFLVENLTVAR